MKANGCVRDIKHKTPLHLAADRGTARQVRVLTQAAPSCVWMRDDQRRTPLHYAVISMKRYSLIKSILFPEWIDHHDQTL